MEKEYYDDYETQSDRKKSKGFITAIIVVY